MKKIRKLTKKIMKIPILLFYRFCVMIFRVDKKIILFESNLGRNYSGNPRYIYEDIVSRGLDRKLQCYFILEDPGVDIQGKVRKIKRISLSYFIVFAKAGFWVSDTRMPGYLIKRKAATYVQTWHGTPLKRLALDMFDIKMEGEGSLAGYKKEFVKNVSTWDYLISQNAYSTEIFRRAFAFDKEILEIGYPRNDILVNRNNAVEIRSIKKRLGLPENKKIILYAPTWRDDQYLGPHSYKFAAPIDFSCLRNALSGGYIMIIKAHYLVGEQLDISQYQGFLYQFDAGFDISELYLVSDYLITDYSSVMFDYSLLKRPMLFYTYDLEFYKNNLRGFYFDLLKEVPGPVVSTTEQLAAELLSYQAEKYKAKYEAFVSKYNHADNGEASKKVVDLIVSHGGTGI